MALFRAPVFQGIFKKITLTAVVILENDTFSDSTKTVFLPGSTCEGLGLSGCCDDFQDSQCQSADGSCFCDRVCHSFRDCCADVLDVGCFNSECKHLSA